MARDLLGKRTSFAERFSSVEDAVEGTEGLLTEEQIEADGVRWEAIARSSAEFAVALGRGGTNPLSLIDPATALYRAVLDVEDAQARLLRAIDKNVKLLVDEPFRTGRTFVRRAFDKVDHPERSTEYLCKAQDKFYEAQSLATEPLDESVVEMHLAIVYFLRGYVEDGQELIESAYQKVAAQVIELAERTGNTKVLTTGAKWSLLLTGFYGAAYLAIKKFKNQKRDKGAQQALREILPLLNCLAELHTSTGARADELLAVELVEVSRDRFELVEVAA